MQIIRFYEPTLQSEREFKLNEENTHIAFFVLRLQSGHPIQLINGHGKVAKGEVTECTKKQVIVTLKIFEDASPLLPALTLFQALPKADKLEWVLQKGVEWGVQHIVLLQSEHAVPQPKKDKIDRWNKIAIEALRQSGNPFLPEIVGPMSLEEACKKYAAEASILFDEFERKTSVREMVGAKPPKSIRFAIGPEGGWSDRERQIFKENQFVGVGMAPYILRVETAATGAMAIFRSFYWKS